MIISERFAQLADGKPHSALYLPHSVALWMEKRVLSTALPQENASQAALDRYAAAAVSKENEFADYVAYAMNESNGEAKIINNDPGGSGQQNWWPAKYLSFANLHSAVSQLAGVASFVAGNFAKNLGLLHLKGLFQSLYDPQGVGGGGTEGGGVDQDGGPSYGSWRRMDVKAVGHIGILHATHGSGIVSAAVKHLERAIRMAQQCRWLEV
jgi:hypothetical protein